MPLAALRGFEAAARRLSFTDAATELSLTQSSISRQIATLERAVGKALFVRKTRALALTSAGEHLLRTVVHALAQIDRTVDDLRGLDQTPRLSIATYASFASLWLVPRLAAYQRLHPATEIRIDAGDRHVDLTIEGIDLAVRWTSPARAPKSALLLLEESIIPAVSPRLIERAGVRLRTPLDLCRLPQLDMDDAHPTSLASTWARWFEHVGVTPTAPAGRIMFSFVDQAVQAAIRGQGVVMGRKPFIDDQIANGELIAPFPDTWMPTGYAYYLVDNPQRADRPHVQSFRAWLVDEFRRGPRRLT